MKFFVKMVLFSSLHGEMAAKAREHIGPHLQKIASSGKMVEGGVFGGKRGGYMVLDVQSAKELTELLAPTILDNFEIESYPLMSFEDREDIFKKIAGKQ